MRKHAYIPTDIVYYKHTEVDTDTQSVVNIMEVHVSNDCKNKIYMLYYCIRIQSKLYQKEENMGKGGSDVNRYNMRLCCVPIFHGELGRKRWAMNQSELGLSLLVGNLGTCGEESLPRHVSE